MVKKILFSVLLVLSVNFLPAQEKKLIQRPKLVVGIVVDQMRWDYLYRYYNRFGEDGFKRMLNEGFSCENTMINYLPSYTAVGHTVIYTGSVPAIDGIVGNDWIDQNTGRKWYCTEDTTVTGIGPTGKAGKMSPRNNLVSTITDELRLATNFQSKVVGISLKDRASILPAGHTANGAFWFDDSTASFITSSYYMDELPGWVKKFNDQKEPEKLMVSNWNTLYPIGTYMQSTADNVNWEGKFKKENEPVFPHDLKTIYNEDHENLRSTPFGNTLTLDFAKAAVNGYNLGKGAATDFLTINCASTDYVGHKYGPNSIEVEDTYLRLDKDLASFFRFLDEKAGKGNYLVFLSADHGAAHAIGFMREHNLPADFLDQKKILLNEYLKEQFGIEDLTIHNINYHISFDEHKIKSANLDRQSVKNAAIAFLQKQPGVQFAVDIENIGSSPIPEPVKRNIINGYNPKRCGPVMIIPEPGWFGGKEGGTGTTHGNWNPYDTHIPLLFMGWGIKHGSTNRTVQMSDISPTLAALLHIQMPNGSVGKVIEEVIKK